MTDHRLRRFLAVIIATLLSLGCVAVYSATAIPGAAYYGQSLRFVAHHLLAIGLGLGVGFGCLAIPPERLRQSAKLLVALSVILLVVVGVCGAEIGGARRWFRLGRLSLQPSEFAQLALVVYLADFLARKRAVIQQVREGVLPPVLVTGGLAGLVLLQPDLGTAIVMASVLLLLLVVAKARWQHLQIVLVIGLIALVVLVAGVDYRRRRILAFLHPEQDPLGAGFQILQSYMALADGGIIGQGIGASMQKLFYLPGAHTDFIFAIMGEELGLIGTTAIIGLFGLLVACGLRMAHGMEDLFQKYLICGCVGLIGSEALVNMAVVTGLLPTKGLPLPLVSYGGTSMVGNLVACALIFHASRRRPAVTLGMLTCASAGAPS